jgi:hypothetical protein
LEAVVVYETDADLVHVIIALLFYCAPSIIAGIRKHRSLYAIIAVNLLFGWTVIGWIWAFIWALANTHNGPINVRTLSQARTLRKPFSPLRLLIAFGVVAFLVIGVNQYYHGQRPANIAMVQPPTFRAAPSMTVTDLMLDGPSLIGQIVTVEGYGNCLGGIMMCSLSDKTNPMNFVMLDPSHLSREDRKRLLSGWLFASYRITGRVTSVFGIITLVAIELR